jgi:hypothetical protein
MQMISQSPGFSWGEMHMVIMLVIYCGVIEVLRKEHLYYQVKKTEYIASPLIIM